MIVFGCFDFNVRFFDERHSDVGCVFSDVLLLLHGRFTKLFLEHTFEFDFDIVFQIGDWQIKHIDGKARAQRNSTNTVSLAKSPGIRISQPRLD